MLLFVWYLLSLSVGGSDTWVISVDERAKHDQQFHSLPPTPAGFITGNHHWFSYCEKSTEHTSVLKYYKKQSEKC